MLRDRFVFPFGFFLLKKKGVPVNFCLKPIHWHIMTYYDIYIHIHTYTLFFSGILRTTGKKRIRNWLLRPMNIFWGNVCWENMRETHGFPMFPVAYLLPILYACFCFFNHQMMDLISRHPRPAAVLEVTPQPSGKVAADRRWNVWLCAGTLWYYDWGTPRSRTCSW